MQQVIRRQVDHHHFVGVVEHVVGYSFPHPNANDPTHQIVKAFQVLDVEGGPHIDAGAQQFFHVLPAFRVARAGHVAVGQFIHQQHGGSALQGGVEVEFGEGKVAVQAVGAGQLFKAVEQVGGFLAAVGFHHAGEYVTAQADFPLRRVEHGAGLAHTGVGAEVDTQFAAQGGLFFLLDPGEQGVGVGAFFV